MNFRKNESRCSDFLLVISDIINSMELEQDDPCVVKNIKEKFLFPPSSEPLNVQSPADRDPSVGQAQIVRELNKNQVCNHSISFTLKSFVLLAGQRVLCGMWRFGW